jgi:hypothetical protein
MACSSTRRLTIDAPAHQRSARKVTGDRPEISSVEWLISEVTLVIAGSGDLELLVAEVCDELEGAAEGRDVAVQDVLGGYVSAFNLGYTGN